MFVEEDNQLFILIMD